jgi:hypothetical protein
MNELLREILVANRAEPEAWIASFLIPKLKDLGCTIIVDDESNVYVPPTGDDSVLFVAHTDTVDLASNGDRELTVTETTVSLAAGQSNRCLGADDGAGIYVLLQLIMAGVEGGYLFTTGEESGGIGVMHFIGNNETELTRYDMCLEFDRFGYNEIITNQSPGDCASMDFAETLSDILNATNEEFKFAPSEGGIYTDNADLSEFIPECVNVAIGYQGHHTQNEWLDFVHVEDLIQGLVWMARSDAFAALPIERTAGDYGDAMTYFEPTVTYTNDSPPDTNTMQGFITEYPAVITEYLESIGVDLYELNDFANRAGYTMGDGIEYLEAIEDDYNYYDQTHPY